MRLKRVYRNYLEWEEIHFNMWGEVEDRKDMLEKAILFTGDYELYGKYMLRVINEWPVSCENALTDYSLNRKAWLGHAATALALLCPEDITRCAWGKLSDEQRFFANKKAGYAIAVWERAYRKDKQILPHLGEPLL